MSGEQDSGAGRMPGFPGAFPGMGFPGMPGGMPGLDPEALQQMMQDPTMQRMMQAVTQDPTFMEMARQMQESLLSGGMGGLSLGGGGLGGALGSRAPAEGGGDSEAAPAPGALALDPAHYMQAMERLMGNPDFLDAANSLGKRLLEQSMGADTPEAAAMVALMGNPRGQELFKAKMEALKEDPEVRDIIAEIELGGQASMMTYMQDPEVMTKLGKKFQDVMKDPELQAILSSGREVEVEGGDEAEAEEEATIFSLASQGDAPGLRAFLGHEGVSADERDEEGRTALHFASGYGELECMKALLEAGADANARDDNQNTALHYAAGYGNVESATTLLERGADPTARNAEGKTAAEVAEMNEQAAVAEALRAAEGRASEAKKE